MEIIAASNDDNELLSELAIKSKSYWGYSKKDIESWRKELTISSKYIEKNNVYKLIHLNKTIGFYAFIERGNTTIELDFFFVSEKYIGNGFGAILMKHFLEKAEELNHNKVFLIADPNATTFYLKTGFKIIDYNKSSIIGRSLPVMEKIIAL